ncbi:MAG: glycosyltransferase family 2 protein [Lachnospiraceae bacterium]
MRPIVSVIVTVYNGEKYLKKCVDSILNQTLSDIEIICIDNNSNDTSLEILQEYASKDRRIRVISQKNMKTQSSRSVGLNQASGKYILFLEDNDFLDRTMLEELTQKIEEDGADFIALRSNQFVDNIKKFKRIVKTLDVEALPPYTPFNFRQITANIFWTFQEITSDKLYNRNFLEKNQEYIKKVIKNDTVFVFSTLILAKKITYLDKVLVHQNIDDEESAFERRDTQTKQFYETVLLMKDMLIETGFMEELEQDFVNYALSFSLRNLKRMRGAEQEKTYKILKEEGFEKLGILNREEDYFYDSRHYAELLDILKYSFEEYTIKISVVIPVHNAEKYIRETLLSVLENQDINLEVICVDDCSDDNTFSILKEFEKKYSNVKVLKNEKVLYAGESRNRGLKVAKGQYMHFLDADDLVIKDAYKPVYQIAKENNLDFIKTKVKAFDDQTGEEVKNGLYSLSGFDPMLDERLINFHQFPGKFFSMSVVPWNGLYKREFLMENEIRFNHLFCVNDRSFFITVCVLAKRMMVTRKLLVDHRVNIATSLVGRRAQHFDCQFESYKLMEKICEENHVNEKVKFEILEHEMYDLISWYKKFKEQGILQEGVRDELIKFLTDSRMEYFESYGKKSRWLQYKSII